MSDVATLIFYTIIIIFVSLILYFIIKYAVKNAIKEAYEEISGNKPYTTLEQEETIQEIKSGIKEINKKLKDKK